MKYLLIALTLLVVGCDNPDCWEYETLMPTKSTTEDLLAAESMLYSNGYKRVNIKISRIDGGYIIRATKKESEVKRDDS